MTDSYAVNMSSTSGLPKILLIVGTRPEVIKMAPVHASLQTSAHLEVSLCSTGQHLELLTTALADFQMKPDFRLDILEHGQSLSSLTAKAVSAIAGVLDEVRPDAVLVHGDTTTMFTAALSAFYDQIPVGHVEAGLRTNNIFSPFPEEFNRQAVSRISKWNFAPTPLAAENLKQEGVLKDSIFVTGNTIVDSIRILSERSESGGWSEIIRLIKTKVGFDILSNPFVVVTTHRRENLSGGVENIFDAILELASHFPKTFFILPLHPNPIVQFAAQERFGSQSNIRVIEHLPYPEFLYLVSQSCFVITDSGGVQEEAVTLGTKVFIARSSTERPEGIDGGGMEVIGSETQDIFDAASRELAGEWKPKPISVQSKIYGDGFAADRIRNVIENYFS